MPGRANRFDMETSISALDVGLPSFAGVRQPRKALLTIQHVGIGNMVDEDMQPRVRRGHRARARIDSPDKPTLHLEDYPPATLLLLEQLARRAGDRLAHVRTLIRRHVERRRDDCSLRPRVRFAREALNVDLQAALDDLGDERDDDDGPPAGGGAHGAPQRKRRRRAESPMETNQQQANTKKPRLELPEQDVELGGVRIKQKELGHGVHIKKEEGQEYGLRYVLDYAPLGQDSDQEGIKQEEEQGDVQHDDHPQDAESSARASQRPRRGQSHRCGKQRRAQNERREKRAEQARQAADILSAYPRRDALSYNFETFKDPDWISRLLEAKIHRLAEIKRLLAFSEQDREPEAAKFAAHLLASSALRKATRNLEGRTKFEFLEHHVLDMHDDRTHLEHKCLILETSIRKLHEFINEHSHRVGSYVEESVLAALS